MSRALDLGCGTGELTATLNTKYGVSHVFGIDSSAEMLKRSSAYVSDHVQFEHSKIEGFKPYQPFDLIVSNAALQWLSDHRRTLEQIKKWLNPGGHMAIQMPANHDHASHLLAAKIAAEFFVEARETTVQSIDTYARWLFELGFCEIRSTMRVYLHPLKDAREVVEWTKGTLLTFYQDKMEPNVYKEFLDRYSAEWMASQPNGPYLYTFKRILIWARLAS